MASDFSESNTGVKKTAILTHNGGHTVVAFTGDGEINGKLTWDILAESVARNSMAETSINSVVETLKAEFATDVGNFAWKKPEDKEQYLHEARVVLHILTDPKKHCIWVVTPLHAQECPFLKGANESFSGVKKVECFTGNYRHWDLNLVRSLLPKCIDSLCTTEPTCGYPVDVTVWKPNSAPETVRCMNLNELNAYLAALSM